MPDVQRQLEKLLADATRALATADEAGLRRLEIRLLGRKGEMNRILAAVPTLAPDARAAFGAAANVAKQRLEQEITRRRTLLAREMEADLAEREWIDVTEPGVAPASGHRHPTSAAIGEIVGLFERIGFRRARYGEAEWDHYAFGALNMPADHAARDEWETFFLDAPAHPTLGKPVLTPHTSNAQIREMERRKPPIRMVSVGKTYRRQSDVSHIPMFHQFEGLVIDRSIALTHLRGVLDHFFTDYFGADRSFRLRPYHFMFTEPSFEIDISCGLCEGTGKTGGAPCRLCKSGWLELGGAGMVHPNVLRAGGVDPKEFSGFAFGWGVERTWMMRAGVQIPDIRMLYANDMRFLDQF
jgi:phenylalanyl-tRNA synthetase alpha chain